MVSRRILSVRVSFSFVASLVYVHADDTSNITEFQNFTIEWHNFSVLSCAVPTVVSISLFSCLPPANVAQVSDLSCLQPTTINFDANTCQASSAAATSASTGSSAFTTVSTQVKAQLHVYPLETKFVFTMRRIFAQSIKQRRFHGFQSR